MGLGDNMTRRKNESKEEYNKRNVDKRDGYFGMYKGKHFLYKVKLPKAVVRVERHHVVYRDSDPNYGLIFCTSAYHRWTHSKAYERWLNE